MFAVAWLNLAFRVVVTVWLATISVWDRRQRRVPNWLVLPVMGTAFLWQAYESIVHQQNAILFVGIAWIVVFALWRGHVFGGGDAKLLMALFALFPTTEFLVLFSVVVCLVSIPLLILKHVRVGGRPLRNARQRLDSRRLLPTAEQLRTEGRPHCWTFALPGAIYVWWAW